VDRVETVLSSDRHWLDAETRQSTESGRTRSKKPDCTPLTRPAVSGLEETFISTKYLVATSADFESQQASDIALSDWRQAGR